MPELGKVLVVVGLALAAVGVLLWAGVGRDWLGRLPGDVEISRGNFRFFFPLTTFLLISAALTLLLWLVKR